MKVRTNTANQNEKEKKHPWLARLMAGSGVTHGPNRDSPQNPFQMPQNFFLMPQNSFLNSKLKPKR
jgi:hypothetical protein